MDMVGWLCLSRNQAQYKIVMFWAESLDFYWLDKCGVIMFIVSSRSVISSKNGFSSYIGRWSPMRDDFSVPL